MSPFEELCSQFRVWREEAWHVRIAFMRLPHLLADALQEYLGSPKTFADTEGSHRRYVSIASATWLSDKEEFNLKISEGLGFSEVILHSDGRFYFALVVYLEGEPQSFPKEPFWILFSVGWESNTSLSLRIQRSGQTFVLPLSYSNTIEANAALVPVCRSIVNQIAKSMERSPFVVEDDTNSNQLTMLVTHPEK